MIKSMLNELLDVFYPKGESCRFCDKALNSWEVMWCIKCKEKIDSARKNFYSCSKCARFITTKRELCSFCQNNEYEFVYAKSVSIYEGLLKDAVQDFKYRKKQSLAEPLGRLLALTALKEKSFLDCDIILPVPMFSRKLKERGFNQAEVLAYEVSGQLKIAHDFSILKKNYHTADMTGLSKTERHDNLLGVFSVKDNKRILGKNILLIDDIFTTGFTVSFCSETLNNAGAKGVFVLVLGSSFDK